MFTYSKSNRMEFLEGIDKFYVEIGMLIVFVIGYLIIQLQKNLKLTLQYCLYSYGIAMLLLSLYIPHVFPGYPNEISDLDNKKRLLYHLQTNKEAIYRTAEVLREMAFLTFVLLITTISKIIKYAKLENPSK